MYNDLQDALGYRADQNAPFDPDLYDCASATAITHLPINPSRRRLRGRAARSRWRPTGHVDADRHHVFAADRAGVVA